MSVGVAVAAADAATAEGWSDVSELARKNREEVDTRNEAAAPECVSGWRGSVKRLLVSQSSWMLFKVQIYEGQN